MRQQVSVGVVVIVIVVILAIVAGIGYFVLRSKKGPQDPQDMPEDARQMFEEQQKKAQQERGGRAGQGGQAMPEDPGRRLEEEQRKGSGSL